MTRFFLCSLFASLLLAGCGGSSAAPCVLSVQPLATTLAPSATVKLTATPPTSDSTGINLTATTTGGTLTSVPNSLGVATWNWTAPAATGTFLVSYEDGACSAKTTLTVQ